MALNYLPFARKEIVVVPARKADRVQTGGFAVTDLARMATGGTKRVIIQDVTVQQPLNEAYGFANHDTGLIRIRIGVDGRTYLTEDLYDYRVYADMGLPMCSVWDWSCGKRTPYRIYPGQKMSVLMARSPNSPEQCRNNAVPLAAMFNGMKVKHKSPVGTKEGEPIMLHGMKLPSCEEAYQDNDLMLIESMRFQCPKDNPVDLYSVTLSEYDPYVDDWAIYITDGNERPIWDNRTYSNIINIIVSPISMGYGGLLLEPDETLRVDLENGAASQADDLTVTVMYRGVLEVDDGR
jgi:hypothetical protein